jgi:thiamine biosynthesis lipoprotein
MSAALVALLLAAASPREALHRHEATRLSMGCSYGIVAYGRDAEALPRAVEAALDEVDRIDRLMSHYKPDSPLSRLNREAAAGPVGVDPELLAFIAEALRYGRDSQGAFDITVGPLMKTWGFFRGEGRLPSSGELEALRGRIGYQHVHVDQGDGTIRFDQPGVELDLGGIAKGYAVDRAIGVLRRAGITTAFVSAGGSTVYGLGAPPGETGWEVRLQDPLDARRVALVARIRDRAFSVAGTSEKFFEVDGVRYSHIMDPRTLRPVQGVLTVAVSTDTGTAGDAMDDVLFVLGVEASRRCLPRLPRVNATFFLPGGRGGWRSVEVHGGQVDDRVDPKRWQ